MDYRLYRRGLISLKYNKYITIHYCYNITVFSLHIVYTSLFQRHYFIYNINYIYNVVIIVLQDAEGEKNGRNETEIPEWVDGNAADGQDRERQEKRGNPHPPEDVFDPVPLLIVHTFPHRTIQNREAVEDRKA